MEPKTTYLHRLDVRTKLIAFVCVVTLVFLFSSPFANLVILVALAAFVLPSGIGAKNIFGALKPLIPIFVIIVAFALFTDYGPYANERSNAVMFYLLPDNRLPATIGGLHTGFTFLLRIFIMVISTMVLIMATAIGDLIEFFNKIRASYKLSLVVTLAISFIPTLIQKKDMIFQAQKARGAGISQKGAIKQLAAFIPIMVPLIINSILMANNLAISLTNRGYGANNSITTLYDIKMKPVDYIMVLLMLLATAACFYLRFGLSLGRI